MGGYEVDDLVMPGVYRHYKHTEREPRYYQVLGVGRHTETGEKLVIYVPLYPIAGPVLQVRPLEMFRERVQRFGATVARYEYVGQQVPA